MHAKASSIQHRRCWHWNSMAQIPGKAVFLFLLEILGLDHDPAQNHGVFIQQQNWFCNSCTVYDHESKDVQGHWGTSNKVLLYVYRPSYPLLPMSRISHYLQVWTNGGMNEQWMNDVVTHISKPKGVAKMMNKTDEEKNGKTDLSRFQVLRVGGFIASSIQIMALLCSR